MVSKRKKPLRDFWTGDGQLLGEALLGTRDLPGARRALTNAQARAPACMREKRTISELSRFCDK
ncbi:MAG: hypothetical protein WCL44_04230 [bacterium]